MVQILDFSVRGQLGYDVRINNPEATVEDYRQAINVWLDKANWYRSRNPDLSQCEGCNRCCWERIPLTLVDLYNLMQYLEPSSESLIKAVKSWGYVTAEGPVVDIRLRHTVQGACVFLDPDTSRCKIYAFRPLVCETFICCPSSPRAQQLREAVVNRGEDELIRQWLHAVIRSGVDIHKTPPVNEGRKVMLSLEDWPDTPFAGSRNFTGVKLRELCDTRLWKVLEK